MEAGWRNRRSSGDVGYIEEKEENGTEGRIWLQKAMEHEMATETGPEASGAILSFFNHFS